MGLGWSLLWVQNMRFQPYKSRLENLVLHFNLPCHLQLLHLAFPIGWKSHFNVIHMGLVFSVILTVIIEVLVHILQKKWAILMRVEKTIYGITKIQQRTLKLAHTAVHCYGWRITYTFLHHLRSFTQEETSSCSFLWFHEIIGVNKCISYTFRYPWSIDTTYRSI